MPYLVVVFVVVLPYEVVCTGRGRTGMMVGTSRSSSMKFLEGTCMNRFMKETRNQAMICLGFNPWTASVRLYAHGALMSMTVTGKRAR